jgi:hypothetical protein
MRRLQYWRRMLSVALTCFISRNKTIIFFDRKWGIKRKRKKKKDMQVKEQCNGGCQGFFK